MNKSGLKRGKTALSSTDVFDPLRARILFSHGKPMSTLIINAVEAPLEQGLGVITRIRMVTELHRTLR